MNNKNYDEQVSETKLIEKMRGERITNRFIHIYKYDNLTSATKYLLRELKGMSINTARIFIHEAFTSARRISLKKDEKV